MKKDGLLNRIINKPEGICETCGNLIQVSETALGCKVHDKLILPQYLPYKINNKCHDWQKGNNNETIKDKH